MTQIKKYSISLIVAAAIVIELIGAAQYFMAQRGARQEVLEKAQRDMQESQRVAVVRTEVETAINNIERSIRLTLANPETCYSVASRIIQVNPHIIGVGLAFTPNYYKNKGRGGLYMPYTYDDQPSIASKGKRTGAPHIQTRIPDMDYTQREWYKEKYVDPDKAHLIEQMTKLREVNNRLVKRNQMLAEKYTDLRNRMNSPQQNPDQEWFG